MAGKDGGARRTTVTPKRGRANVSEDGTNASKRERRADASSSDAAELERLRRKNEELEERLRRRDDEELERLRRELAEVRADRPRADDSRTAHGSNIASIDGAKRIAETFAETLTQMGAAFGAIGTFLGGHVNTPKPATPATRGGSSAGSPHEVDATVGEDARGEDDEREDDFRRAVGTVNQRAGVTWTCVAMKDDRAECVAACKHYDGCSWKQTYKSGTSVYFSCSTHVNCDARVKVHSKKNRWLVSSRGEHSGVRELSHSGSADDAGIRQRHSNMTGARRGIARRYEDEIMRMHDEGKTPKAIEHELQLRYNPGTDPLPTNEQISVGRLSS
jgi:hypothetical protein